MFGHKILLLTITLQLLVDGQTQPSSHPPVLQKPSHDNQIPLRKNSNVTLHCRAPGDGSLKYYWERNDSGNWITVDNNNRTSYTTGTTGQYRCNVTNEVGSVVSPVITVYGPPVIQQPEHDNKMPMKRGSRVTLHCTASGYGSLTYHWKRRISENHQWFTIDHSINKTTFKVVGTGQYRCNVTNEAGSVVSPVITAYGPPVIKQPQHKNNVPLREGSSYTISCRAAGYGLLTYYWEKKVSEKWINVDSNNKTSYKTTNTGQYRCNITNEAGSVTSPVYNVYGPPVFLIHPNSHIVTAGMTVSLYCNVSGFAIAYAWEMRNTSGGQWSRIRNSNSYKYDVRNIQQSKQYRCSPGNEAGTFTSNTATIQILKITSHPRNKQLLISSTLVLTCTSSVSSSVTFSWAHNSTIITTQLAANGDTSRLTISNVRYSDGGSYVCIVRSGSLSVTSNTATITVYVPKPVINTHPMNSKVKALTSVTFTCSASDVYGVTYSWHRTNGDIPSTRSRGQNTNTLTITGAIPPDEGMYYCIATNDGGSTSSRSASLTVDDELSITVSPLSQTVSEGGVAIFTATASGIKTREFTYRWFKIEGQKSTIVERTKNLIIDTVRVEDTGLYYSCVTNQWNNQKCSLAVYLIINATSSVFTTHPQDQFIHKNEDAVFECAANGSESLMINWTRNKELISNSKSNRTQNDGNKSVLEIKEATIDDSGIYQCIATNADNEEILSKPAELLILPSLNTNPDNVTVFTGQSVNLTCSATGTDVVYQWMRNDVIISDDNSNVLRINEIKQSDDGIYQCIASNKGGNATSNPAMIKVYDEPKIIPLPSQTLGVLGEQFQITCNATNDKDAPHNMMFTWMTPDGVDHNVKMTSEDDDHTASSTLYISRLARSDNGTYKCYVTNNNASSASVITSTTVIVEERPSQPVNFNATSEDDTSLMLIWSEPVNTKGEVDYYIIYYSDDKTTKTINVYHFTCVYILKNLTPSTQYSIYVTAVRLIGENDEILEGNSSIIVSARTLFIKTVQECGDSDNTGSVVVNAVLGVFLVVSLICCLGLIVIVFKLHRKNVLLQEKLKFTDEKFKVTNPTYADLVVKSDDINMENNPAYQCSSKQDDVKDHHYEVINIGDKVIKPVN